MPFRSEKQRRYLWANEPEIAKRWERDYANGGIARVGLANGSIGNKTHAETFLDLYQNSPTTKDYNINVNAVSPGFIMTHLTDVLPEEIYIGNVLINLKKLSIKINNQTKKINPQERKILEKMLQSPGKVFSRDDIGKIINISKERTIDVMITRLRQKIESNPKNPKYLQTIRGSGYVLWIE